MESLIIKAKSRSIFGKKTNISEDRIRFRPLSTDMAENLNLSRLIIYYSKKYTKRQEQAL